jgi:hypothetical protein
VKNENTQKIAYSDVAVLERFFCRQRDDGGDGKYCRLALCIFNGGNSNLDVNLGDIQATNMAYARVISDPVALICCLPTVRRNAQRNSFTGTPDPLAG